MARNPLPIWFPIALFVTRRMCESKSFLFVVQEEVVYASSIETILWTASCRDPHSGRV